MSSVDFVLLQIGRQFRLPEGGWLILGRMEQENDRIHALAGPGDALLYMEERPGPTALLRHADRSYPEPSHLLTEVNDAASLVVRYGKKPKSGPKAGVVSCFYLGERRILVAEPCDQDWGRDLML